MLTVSAYYGYHWYLTLAYFHMVIGSIDLLTSSDSPVCLHPSAVFYPVYLPDELCHLTTSGKCQCYGLILPMGVDTGVK